MLQSVIQRRAAGFRILACGEQEGSKINYTLWNSNMRYFKQL